jgi:hypothetical protein
MIIAAVMVVMMPGGQAVSGEVPDYGVVAGDWSRVDGDYTLRVKDVKVNGPVGVTYFNPRPIHVSDSRVSLQEGLVKLFVKLQDRGYPGCTYTLYYYTGKDALAGFYYQAEMDQTFEVVFIRKTER